MNPAAIMKLMNAKNRFSAAHPKFTAFLRTVYAQGIEEGTVIEFRVRKPGQEELMANIRVQQSDLELFEELKDLRDS